MKLLLKKYAAPFWRQISLLVGVTVIANLLTSIQPIFLASLLGILGPTATPVASPLPQVGVKSALHLESLGEKARTWVEGMGGGDTWSSLWILCLIFGIVTLVAAILTQLSHTISKWIQARATKEIRKDLLSNYFNLSMDFFTAEKGGELLSRVTRDSLNTSMALGPLVRSFFHNGILILVYTIYLTTLSSKLFFTLLAIAALHYLVTQLLKKTSRKWAMKASDDTALLSASTQEALTSIRVIKSLGAENFEMQRLEKRLEKARQSEFGEANVVGLEPNLRLFIDGVAVIGLILVGGAEYLKHSISFDGFVLFVFVGRLMTVPIRQFATVFTWTHSAQGAFERISKLLSRTTSIPEGSTHKNSFNDKISIEHVSFSYDKEPVLRDVSFEIKKGEVVALVGPSGGGKSTLLDLLLRFFDPQSGLIRIDGLDLRHLATQPYRRLFGVVPQESLLFNDTLLENIRYGRKDATEDDVLRAAEIANCMEFIRELPQGLLTTVGDRGTRISGGQRQRIALARAMVSRPAILLLDEATSALDSESELKVQKAIDTVLESTTAIVVAHRLSTVTHADKIVVLKDGKLEAIGKHSDLLGKNPTYQRLHELQGARTPTH